MSPKETRSSTRPTARGRSVSGTPISRFSIYRDYIEICLPNIKSVDGRVYTRTAKGGGRPRDVYVQQSLKGEALLALMRFLGAYVAEGNALFNKANGSWQVCIGNTDLAFLDLSRLHRDLSSEYQVRGRARVHPHREGWRPAARRLRPAVIEGRGAACADALPRCLCRRRKRALQQGQRLVAGLYREHRSRVFRSIATTSRFVFRISSPWTGACTPAPRRVAAGRETSTSSSH